VSFPGQAGKGVGNSDLDQCDWFDSILSRKSVWASREIITLRFLLGAYRCTADLRVLAYAIGRKQGVRYRMKEAKGGREEKREEWGQPGKSLELNNTDCVLYP